VKVIVYPGFGIAALKRCLVKLTGSIHIAGSLATAGVSGKLETLGWSDDRALQRTTLGPTTVTRPRWSVDPGRTPCHQNRSS